MNSRVSFFHVDCKIIERSEGDEDAAATIDLESVASLSPIGLIGLASSSSVKKSRSDIILVR